MSVLTRAALAPYVSARTARWPEHSRLFVVGDDLGWSIDDDTARLARRAARLGYEVPPGRWAGFARNQSVFQSNHFTALRPEWLHSSHRLGLSYFHGRPGTAGYPEFDDAFAALRANSAQVERVQVTHAEMHDLVLEAGVEPDRVFTIPIGVDIEHFPVVDSDARRRARELLGVPHDAFVAGSFVKDGVGLGEGLEPKLVKAPDTLVATLTQARAAIPELFVLLTGLARGYVRRELTRLGIPHAHALLSSREELGRAYHALDVTLVTSRQEGGPKAALESLAAGVPLVTTRVGQAQELVIDGKNGLVADIDEVGALAEGVERIHDDTALRQQLAHEGRLTAEANADERLDPLWAGLLDGFSRKAER